MDLNERKLSDPDFDKPIKIDPFFVCIVHNDFDILGKNKIAVKNKTLDAIVRWSLISKTTSS